MNILMLTCNIGIPVLMIFIGILYKCNLYKKIDKTLDLIVPIAMFFTGFSERDREHLYKNTNKLALVNRKCSLIWSISGVCTLLLTIISLILNKSNIYNTSVILLEPEFLILVIVFITVEYILKRNFYKKIQQS
ncbi:hypothetical protein ACTQ4K_11560 [Clostridium sporogenes]|uniref:hypothetical protein n=1 Tax=Clostridium sporogenes TaxID=1509 RepID=UPI003F92B946